MRPVAAVREAAELVKFAHTAFALPFALIAAIAAANGLPSWPVLGWILLAMAGARTAAMAFNRLADHRLDAGNPRTARRALPAGRVGRPFAWALVALGAAALGLAAWRLNPLCLALAPLAFAWVLAYSYSKRFTQLSHLWLGLGLGIAPVGAWLAVRGSFALPPLVLAVAVTAWVAGFDVLYSLADEPFDRAAGMHSLPARLGAARAITVARGLHVVAAAGFAAFAWSVGGWGLWAGTAAAAALLAWQHTLIAPGRLERLGTAFFTANGVLALLMFALYLLDMMVRA
ncbi:MAG: putative 4-hydroxybenzoate polyprenyltransferase [Thermoanaerobaculaceae bacterium]|nr:putative 4-hydroxybenzoate polyprenyltransferase [Thermoanaerobaculaceae bacterium]TAM46796.1 MAG: 4-hydroxybenzoate octaprenyltransferase [Acidobacteriota bacterium]